MRSLFAICTLSLAFAASAPHAATFDIEGAPLRDLSGDVAEASRPAPAPVLVGDADSFGRASRYLGLLYSGIVSMARDCSAPDVPKGPDDRCVTLPADPATATTFDLADIGRMTLPARSTNSLLCHWLTPNGDYTLQNTGVARVSARMVLRPYVVVESAALNDPALIDPNTGKPFGGRLETSFSASHYDFRTLDAGESITESNLPGRTCQSGFLSRRNLVSTYGLTDAQAAAVIRGEITLRFGLRGYTRAASTAGFLYGLRVMGD